MHTCSRDVISSHGTVSWGHVFLWGCIFRVSPSLLPFLCIPSSPSLPSPSTGLASGELQVSVFEGLTFLGS